MTSVNEQIQDRTIRHMVYLERFKVSEIKRIRKILDGQVLPSIQAKIEQRVARIIERGSDLGPETTKRLKELEKELSVLSDELAGRVRTELTNDLTELTAHELDWQASAIKDSLNVNLDFVVPSARAVAAISKSTAFAGLTMEQWFDTLSQSTQRNVMAAVNRGIVEGETTDQIVRRVVGTKKLAYTDGVFQTTRRQAETITRTTINHVSNQARIELFKENSDIIAGLKWLATLDSRTSITCASLDGKVFDIDKGPRPPAHPNCRSTMSPVLKDWQELGLKDIGVGQRASINGQVPGDVTFGPWLKKQPLDVQEQVLGVAKAKLFNAGKLDITRFVDANLKPLNLKQLQMIEKKAFKTAGVEI